MDFNLSKICDMLSERIEDYKSSAKKRRIERGSEAPKAKIAKLTNQGQTENPVKQKRTRIMYASTPVDTPKFSPKQISMLSSIMISSSLENTRRLRTQRLNMKARKLTYDVKQDCDKVDITSEMEHTFTPPANFSSVIKLASMDPRERRNLRRKNANARRLTFAEEGNEDENENSLKINSSEIKLDKAETLLSSVSKIHETQSMIVKKLAFDQTEDEDTESQKRLTDYTTELNTPSEVKCKINIKEKIQEVEKELTDFPQIAAGVNSMQEGVQMGYPTKMVLNVGIVIRPITYGN